MISWLILAYIFTGMMYTALYTTRIDKNRWNRAQLTVFAVVTTLLWPVAIAVEVRANTE